MGDDETMLGGFNYRTELSQGRRVGVLEDGSGRRTARRRDGQRATGESSLGWVSTDEWASPWTFAQPSKRRGPGAGEIVGRWKDGRRRRLRY
jgi:hypothetical protein